LRKRCRQSATASWSSQDELCRSPGPNDDPASSTFVLASGA
jgi:hypothetical protein